MTEPIDTSLIVRIKVGHQPRYLLALLWVGLILLGLILAAPDASPIVYFLVASLGAGIATFAFLVMPQFNYLELHRNGFVLRHFRVTSNYRWQDVREVKAFEWQSREMIGVNLAAHLPVKQRAENQKKWGWDLVLTSHYELAPQEIVNMMNEYRTGSAVWGSGR